MTQKTVYITHDITTAIKGSKISLAASVTDKTVTWSSSDEAVATVDESGVVTGVSAGKTTITVKAGEKTDSVEITVRNPSVGDIILADGNMFAFEDIESYTIDDSNKPVAVVAGFNEKGAVLALAYKNQAVL